jgi:hypothetical protein
MRTQPNSQPDVPIDLPVAERIHAAVERFGEPVVVDRSILLLNGGNAGEDFLLYVGGKHAQGLLDGAPALYWPELWGARALLHVWDPKAGTAIQANLENQSWRVREMCARVSQERHLNVLPGIVALTEDEVPRVRIAALRALAELGTAAAADTITARLRDPDKDVRRAAQQSRDALRDRTRTSTDS